MIYGNDVVLGNVRAQSRKGTTYFLGRLGMANVVLIKSDEVNSSGQSVWHLKVTELATRSRM